MNEKEIKEVLGIILNALQRKKFIWRIEGSVSLMIQGVNTPFQDLDITTNNEGIEMFREKLKDYIIKDFFSEKIKGYSIICKINNFEVEINSYGDRKEQFFDKHKTIEWEGLMLPILPLEYSKKLYEAIGRKDKVELISDYLHSTS